MKTALLVVLLTIGVVFAFSVVVRLPLRSSTLDRLKPSKWFHSLILFGKHGAYIELDQRSSGDRILFTKTAEPPDKWLLEIKVSGSNIQASFVDEVESDLAALNDQLIVQSVLHENNNIRLVFGGPGLRDHLALEGLARSLIRRLGHPKSAKYRLTFAGSKDYDAFNQYYGFKR